MCLKRSNSAFRKSKKISAHNFGGQNVVKWKPGTLWTPLVSNRININIVYYISALGGGRGNLAKVADNT